MTPRERQLHDAAQQHVTQAARLQGHALGLRAMRYASLLRWGTPTRTAQQGANLVLTFNGGHIVCSPTGAIVIYPTT
jgi:hypothetical protein